jgi:hypothetical protein
MRFLQRIQSHLWRSSPCLTVGKSNFFYSPQLHQPDAQAVRGTAEHRAREHKRAAVALVGPYSFVSFGFSASITVV